MSSWFKKYRYSGVATLRLFCFPYAGGSSTIFNGWEKRLPAEVDIFALQSPGRGSRFAENPVSCLKTKINTIYKEIIPYMDLPSIFVGHSNGALLAFELARKLISLEVGDVKHVVLSAKRAPQLSPIREALYNLPQDKFIEKLRGYNYTPNEVLENEELMELLVPMLRADFALSDTYKFEDESRLTTSTTLFWGNQDNDISKDDMLAWKKCIDGQVNLIEFDDGHFFIDSSKSKFLEELNKIVKLHLYP